jgi:hypothetical protein
MQLYDLNQIVCTHVSVHEHVFLRCTIEGVRNCVPDSAFSGSIPVWINMWTSASIDTDRHFVLSNAGWF